jgi:V/A-type H+/Na+-transporting ATPase subunit D
VARLTLSKASLTAQVARLKIYQRYLPSLDLKRRQLIRERARAAETLAETDQAITDLRARVRAQLPMACDLEVEVTGLVTVTGVELAADNVMGVRLPRLGRVVLYRRPYALLAKPEWVDRLADLLAVTLELRVHLQVERRRLALLDEAVRTVSQRVNLFDKLLIPRAQANIKRIRVFLADAERAAVVRAKIAKAKRASEFQP